MYIVLIAVCVAGVMAAGALAYAVYEWADGPEFSPTEWREARARDSEHLDDLATDAVESDALIAKSRPELRRMLGRPDRVRGPDRVWEWDIGWINDGIGPGDAGTLRIRFDRRTGRSSKATASQ
jgi:hypothetical protein